MPNFDTGGGNLFLDYFFTRKIYFAPFYSSANLPENRNAMYNISTTVISSR